MKTKNIILTLVAAALFGGCDYLDFDETNGLQTKEDVYKYFDRTQNMLNHIYSFIPQDLGVISGAMRDCASDDAEFANTYAWVQDFNNGAWSALNTSDNMWSSLYTGIRAANGFIVEIQNVDFSRYQYDNAYDNWMKKLPYFIYEARLLRAFYFFELTRRYGDIPMPLEILTADEANAIGKTKFQDVIRFITEECDAVTPHLPVSYSTLPDKQVGRVTKGFAMALKSKALLYAASELHNPDMDKELWKISAKAALNLIDSAENKSWYQLEPTKQSVNNYESKETVLFRQSGKSFNFEVTNFPVRFTDGKTTTTGVCPSQNLADAFETVNGFAVSLQDNGWACDDPAFDATHPYDNRDPRFARTLMADGMTFKDSEIESFKGGKDGGAVAQGGTATGYFLKKYIQESTNFEPDKEVVNEHIWVVYRYAETLLTYAESMIQAFGTPDYTDATYTRSARWALNQVRINAGMPEINVAEKVGFIEKVQNEWRVEFAFEDHRFWDIRRWKIGDRTQTELYGVSIEKLDDGTKLYQKELYESRMWNDRMYLYPLPQDELFKNNNLAPQNPGW